MSEISESNAEPANSPSSETVASSEYSVIGDSTVNVNKLKDNLHQPLPKEEFNNSKENEYINFFGLQVEELVAKTPIENERRTLIKKWKKFFRIFVKTLPNYTIQLSCITAAKNCTDPIEPLTKSLSENMTDLETDDDLMLRLEKPLWYQSFGLYENECQPGPEVTLNMHLIMPESCFHKKDYLNNRYIIKKYYYLLYINEFLKQHAIVTDIKLIYHDNNFLLPILKLHLENDENVTVNIFVSAEKGTFISTCLFPNKINVNENLFRPNVDINALTNTPTAYYNSTLGFDGTLAINISYLSETLRGLKNLHVAIKVLCIWLKRRELNSIGFTEDLVVYFVIYLYQKNEINNSMSCYQIIKNFWSFISVSDLKNEPIALITIPEFIMKKFENYFDVIFLDKTGHYNLTSFLIKDVYEKVRSESVFALKLLNDTLHNSFHQLLLNRYPFFSQYDLTVKISEPTWMFHIPPEDRELFSGYDYVLVIRNLLNILKYALNQRYVHIIPKIETEGNKISKIFFGIDLNPDTAFGDIVFGPAADHVSAVEFRAFWDPFQRDGIVHFNGDTVRSKRQIIKNIIEFVLRQKLDLKYEIFYDELENYLLNNLLVPSYACGTNEETTFKIIKAWNALGNLLRELNVFLKITEIQAVSDIFYYANVFPPIPQNFEVRFLNISLAIDSTTFQTDEADEVSPYIQSINSVLQLSQTSEWPNNLKAICHMKTSFYLQIADLLVTKHGITSRVSPDYIEISFHGLIFKYSLFVQNEIYLMKQASDEIRSTNPKSEFEMEKRYVFLPKIVEGLKDLQARYPSFGPGTALIKRWLRAQLIDDFHFPDTAVDLVNASLYLNSSSNNVNTPQASFLRFLNYFSDFDGSHLIVVVNFDDILTENEINKHELQLARRTHTYPNLFILTPFDDALSVFTKVHPSKQVIARVSKLSSLSVELFEGASSGKLNITVEEIGDKLFIPKYDGFNVLIHLKNSLNSRRYEKIITLEEDDDLVVIEEPKDFKTALPSVVDVNPVDKYLKTLRKNYGKYALFFHDSYGGNVIGVLWYPKELRNVNLKVSQLNGMELDDDELDFNIHAAIEDFEVSGQGLVESIRILT